MRPSRALGASALAILLLAGCGGVSGTGAPAGGTTTTSPSPADNGVAKLTADQILAKATAAIQGADGVRIKGSAGRGADRFDIDMRYTASTAKGTISAGGQPIEMLRIGQTVYVKGSREFWTSHVPAAAVELLTGKWLKTPLTEQRFADLAQLTDLSEAASGILEPDGQITKGEKKTVAGTPAIALVSQGSDGGVLYVATTGTPYPLQITPSDPKEAGKITFTEYDERVTVSPPPSDLVIDVTKLGN